MGFIKMEKQPYPPRLWTLSGYPGSGKSTFATQMRGPILAVDADNRFSEVLNLVDGDAYALSSIPTDNTDTEKIAAILKENMPGSDVKTIVIDSLTAIITPLVTKAMLDNDAGRNRNRAAAFKEKALRMRQLQDAVTKWGKDVLWIYHLQDGRDSQGNKVTHATLPETEQTRLLRSINLQLEIIQDGKRRGVRVVWARRGWNGITLWDETGKWAGMPDRIEAAVYGGLSPEEQDRIEHGFPNISQALAWGVQRGAFKDESSARLAYDEVKHKFQPQTASDMARHWTDEVLKRQEVMAG